MTTKARPRRTMSQSEATTFNRYSAGNAGLVAQNLIAPIGRKQTATPALASNALVLKTANEARIEDSQLEIKPAMTSPAATEDNTIMAGWKVI